MIFPDKLNDDYFPITLAVTRDPLFSSLVTTPFIFTPSHASPKNPSRGFGRALFGVGYNAQGWWRGSVVERRSLAGELSLSCA